MKTSIFIGIGTAILLGLVVFLMKVSISNSEIGMRNTAEAQKQVVEAFFDKMWKVISQQAEISQDYKETFKEVYPKIMEGRYGNENGGTLMKWITESNPTFDVSLYKNLSASVEAERNGFFMEQKKLVDMIKMHKTYREVWPNSMFIGSRKDIEYKIISSSDTKKVMETGEENDIKMFKR